MLLRAVLSGCSVWRSSLKLGALSVSVSLAGYHAILRPLSYRAQCKSRQSSNSIIVRSTLKSHDKEVKFDWLMLWKFLSPDVLLLTVAVLSAVACAVLNILLPLELGALVNTVSSLRAGHELRDYINQLLPSGLRLILLYASQGALTSLYIGVLSVLGERLATRLRCALFHSLLEQDISFFDQHKTGELVSRLSGDVQDLKSSFKLVISQGLRGVTQLLGCAASLFYISPQMTAIVGLAVPLMVATGTLIGSVLRQLSRRAQDQVAIATGVADEALSNVRTVRAFASETSEESLYRKELALAERDTEQLGLGIALFQGLSNFAINGLILGVISHGGVLLASNQITPGQLMSFLVATQTIQKSLGTLSVLFSQVVRGASAGGRVFQYIQQKPSVPLTGGLMLDTVKGDIQLEGLCFAYPTREEQMVLNNLSLSLPAGQVTALCGLSGAGKSTVGALLERFYEPVNGSISLDGVELSSLDPSWLRREVIGYIDQEPVLFAASISENIRYGRPSATDKEVEAAAKLANAHEFIESFPDGYSTVVGERGVTLSGGQKQRVAIARAVLKNPCVLILDEATSALDAHSESLVQEALDRACQGRTVLVIAHRLSTIRNAHQIAVLHQGRLKEVGSHSQLMKNGKFYKELIRRQTALD